MPTSPWNSAASAQLAANAGLTRLVVTLIRTAIFSSGGYFLTNASLASGCGRGMAFLIFSLSE